MKKINIDMEKIFCVEKTENHIVLFNLKGINGLNIGDVFFRRNKDNTTEILQDYEYLNKEYLDKIVDNLSQEEQYDFDLIESKSI
jgi:hypothetical protein